ncbi:hypothetical protein CYMTET_54241 [Cymbomonas tetramitiformis]|uniref:Uncharacterized protein n=1 Tax=Cymbomonas tetramitiformis TaxID=36881 RepID=A0AAE0ENX8_9CHLO|nr:hypothetical protein CYMTET_54241 [Cymbomonas tetramitiformis]
MSARRGARTQITPSLKKTRDAENRSTVAATTIQSANTLREEDGESDVESDEDDKIGRALSKGTLELELLKVEISTARKQMAERDEQLRLEEVAEREEQLRLEEERKKSEKMEKMVNPRVCCIFPLADPLSAWTTSSEAKQEFTDESVKSPTSPRPIGVYGKEETTETWTWTNYFGWLLEII